MVKTQLYLLAGVLAICLVQAMAAPGSFSLSDEESEASKNAFEQGKAKFEKQPPSPLSKVEREGSAKAFNRARALFDGPGSRDAKPKPADLDEGVSVSVPLKKQRVYSIDTVGKFSKGGGKPTRLDWNQHHNYTPLPPQVVPDTYGPKYPTQYMDAEETANRIKPQHPYQFTT